MRIHKILILLSIIFLAPLHLSAQENKQEDKDSLVVLLSSKSAQMVDVEGARYRKVVGPARFLHNNTYLICDTAYWNVETQIIDAWGNVSILQDETVLTSEKLKYLIEEDLAQFRGAVVQLTDKDHNTLRTRHLDYNTKDSVAVFMNGGAMRDKDGQIIESRSGTYDSKIKTFVFENDVNMFTDSVFVKTRELVYESDLDLATFGHSTDAWKDDNMLSSNRGWYDRGVETFFFTDNVHVMTEDQEGWSDSLFFYRNTSDVEMLGNAQVSDTTRNVFALAGRIHYMDSLSKITLTRKPAVISQTEEEDGSIDTVYLGAEKLVYYTLKKCDISESVIADAEARLSSLDVDPVGTFRKKAAEEAAKAAEEEAKKDPNYRPQGTGGKGAQPGSPGGNLPAPGQGFRKKTENIIRISRRSTVWPCKTPGLPISTSAPTAPCASRIASGPTGYTARTGAARAPLLSAGRECLETHNGSFAAGGHAALRLYRYAGVHAHRRCPAPGRHDQALLYPTHPAAPGVDLRVLSRPVLESLHLHRGGPQAAVFPAVPGTFHPGQPV